MHRGGYPALRKRCVYEMTLSLCMVHATVALYIDYQHSRRIGLLPAVCMYARLCIYCQSRNILCNLFGVYLSTARR